MRAKKSKLRALPRLHEVKVDEIVAKGQEALQTSRRPVKESRIMNEVSRQLIKECSQRKKK